MDTNYNPYGNPQNNTCSRPNYMETFALTLALFSIVTCSCCYLSLPMGAVAIVLALLSRGGQMKLSSKAKLAIAVGIIGILVTIIMYAICFYVTLTNLEMFEAMLREYCDTLGMDFEALYGDMFRYLNSLDLPQNPL